MRNRYVQLTAIFMMSVSGLHGAVAPKDQQTKVPGLCKFKTAEDISGAVKWRARSMGFIAGVAENTAAFNLFLASASKEPGVSFALYSVHWVATIALAFSMIDRSEKKVGELQSAERSFMPVMVKMGCQLDNLEPAKLLELRDEYKRLYDGGQGMHTLNVVKVRTSFNSLLQQRVQIQDFWYGALNAALLGPICGVAGTAVLSKLGLLSTSDTLD